MLTVIRYVKNKLVEWFRSTKKEKITTINFPGYLIDRLLYTKLSNKDINIIPLDAWLKIPLTEKDLDKILNLWMKHYKKYVPEQYDCDDYAMCLKCFTSYNFNVNGIGIVLDYGMGHAYNVTVIPFVNVRIIEPQTGEHFDIQTAISRGYLKCPCAILI